MRAKGPSHTPAPRQLNITSQLNRVTLPQQHAHSYPKRALFPGRLLAAISLSAPPVHALPRINVVSPLSSRSLSHEIPSSHRFFSHHIIAPKLNTALDLSSNHGLQWLHAQQEKGNFNFGLVMQQKLQLQAQDIVVGFRVQRDYTKFAQTDLYYLFDPTNTDQFKQFWESVLAPIQIARQSTVDLFRVNKSHRVWAESIASKYGNLTRVLIGVDFVDHEYALMSKLSAEQTLAYIKEHAEKFKVRSETAALNQPVVMPLNLQPK